MPVIQLPEILPVFYSIGQCFLVAGEVEIHGMAVHAAPDILHGINRFADYHFCSKGKHCDICGYGVIWLRHGTGIGETAAAGTFAAAAVSGGLEDPEGFPFL